MLYRGDGGMSGNFLRTMFVYTYFCNFFVPYPMYMFLFLFPMYIIITSHNLITLSLLP